MVDRTLRCKLTNSRDPSLVGILKEPHNQQYPNDPHHSNNQMPRMMGYDGHAVSSSICSSISLGSNPNRRIRWKNSSGSMSPEEYSSQRTSWSICQLSLLMVFVSREFVRVDGPDSVNVPFQPTQIKPQSYRGNSLNRNVLILSAGIAQTF